MRWPLTKRPVARQAVVGGGPLVAEALELGVQARDLGVPLQRDVVAGAAPDRDALARRVEHEQPLGAVAVAQDEERRALALGLDALAQLGGRGRVGGEWRLIGLLHGPLSFADREVNPPWVEQAHT